MREPPISVPPSHPYSAAVRLANVELSTAAEALDAGNHGKARVCARRAVGFFIQAIAPTLASDTGAHSMANLRWLHEDPALPEELRNAARRLLAGARDIAHGATHSIDPVADATFVINYFLVRAST